MARNNENVGLDQQNRNGEQNKEWNKKLVLWEYQHDRQTLIKPK